MRPGGPARILVVDDEQMLARVMARRLASRGFEVEMAFGGPQALQWFDENPAPDLVLMDVMMPEIGGLDVLERVRERYSASELPVVMLTSRSDSATIIRALETGANDYVTKPAELPVLLARVNGQLDRREAVRAMRRSEERYALAALGSRDVLWDWIPKSDALYLAPGCDRYVDVRPGEAYEGPLLTLTSRVHPDDTSRAVEAVSRVLTGETDVLDLEVRLLDTDSSEWLWLLIRGTCVRNENGYATRMAGSISDRSTAQLHDRTTGLPNRRLFLQQLERHIEEAGEARPRVLVLSLDRVDQVASTLGPDGSDALAVAAADRLLQRLEQLLDTSEPSPAIETLCRVSGHQYAVSILTPHSAPHAERHAARLQEALAKPYVIWGHEVRCGASVGIAVAEVGSDPEDVLSGASTAAVRARTLPGRISTFSEEARRLALDRLALESELAAAVEAGQLHLEYQTIVDLKTGHARAVEALCRWEHPTRGRISPDVFIPIAESTGLIVAIGAWVMETGARAVEHWVSADGVPLRLCVNASPIQFELDDLSATVRRILDRTGFDPKRLELEVTEGVFAQNSERLRATLTDIRSLGVRTALDDFGTGYSSLAYLTTYPFDTIKLDRSFVANLPGVAAAEAITRAALAIAHELDLEVVAEGIEEEAQARFLLDLTCDFGQGWMYARPQRAEHWDEVFVPPRARAL